MEQKWLWSVGVVIALAIAATLWVESRKNEGDHSQAAAGTAGGSPTDPVAPIDSGVSAAPLDGAPVTGGATEAHPLGGTVYEPPVGSPPPGNPSYAPEGQGFEQIPPPPPQNYSDADDGDAPPPPPPVDGVPGASSGSGDSDYIPAGPPPANDQEN
jgi:hypothetical protein